MKMLLIGMFTFAGFACGQLFKCSGDLEKEAQAISDPDWAAVFVGIIHGLTVEALEDGNYVAAGVCGRSALTLAQRVLGPEHPDTGTSLDNLANLLQIEGDYARAEPMYRRALAIREKALGAEHPDTAQSLHNLAAFVHAKGHHGEAESLLRRALAIREKTLGTEHIHTGTSVNNLATIMQDKGDYVEAEILLRRALAIIESAAGSEDPHTATALNNLATLLYHKRDIAGAEPLYRRALAIQQEALGADHPDAAVTANNIANLLTDKGDYAGAEELFHRVLAINEKALGPEHAKTGAVLHNMAQSLEARRDYVGAERLFRRALEVIEKTLGAEHPMIAIALGSLAATLEVQGNHAEASPLLERAFRLALQSGFPSSIERLGFDLAMSRWRLGRHEALEAVLEQVAKHGGMLLEQRMSGAESAVQRRLANNYNITDLMLSLAAIQPDNLIRQQIATRAIVGAKGAVQELEIEQAQRDRSSGTLVKRQEERTLRARISECWIQSLLDCTKLEQALGEMRERLPKVELATEEQIRRHLSRHEVLVEYVRYHDVNPNLSRLTVESFLPGARLKDNAQKDWYAAYVMTNKETVLLPRVAEAFLVDMAAAAVHKAQSKQDSEDHHKAAQTLYELVWKPLAPHVAGYSTVFVAPDSELRLVNLYSLVDEQGEALLDKPALLVGLTTGRDLVRVARKRGARKGVRHVVIRHPAYLAKGDGDRAQGWTRSGRAVTAGQQSDEVCKELWRADLREIGVPRAMMDRLRTLGGGPLVEFEGTKATVNTVQSLKRPGTIWLFTHGYYCPNSSKDEMEAVRIAMAGAGVAPTSEARSQGWLTARDIAEADLLDTELVAMLTCVTARATGRTNEGAYGVQQGLMLAGVRSSITMLWNVRIEPTLEMLMGVARNARVKGRAEAYRDALRSVRAKKGWGHPYFWAGSMLVGDPAPMRF